MNDDGSQKISRTLKSADEKILKEIIREAESFLEAQLKVGLACDQRAMAFAGMLAAIFSILLGGTASMVAAKIQIWPHILAIACLWGGTFGGFVLALLAARPTKFFYSGNNPRMWITDIEQGRSLEESLGGQAALYVRGIERNKEILSNNHTWLSRAQGIALMGLVAAGGVEMVIILSMIGNGSIAIR